MRKYIKTLAMLLMVSLGFTACNENDDFDNYKVSYPASVDFGYYHSDYTSGSDYEYGVLLTKTAEGDTVVQVLMEGKPIGSDSGSVRTLMTSHAISYNDSLGVLTAVATAEESFYEDETTLKLSYKMDKQSLIMKVNYGKKSESAVLNRVQKNPSVTSRWVCQDMTLDLGKAMAGTLTYTVSNEEKVEQLTYDFNDANGRFNTESGIEAQMKYNQFYQLEVEMNGQTYTFDRTFSTPEPEIFELVANGTYMHAISVLKDENGKPMGQPVFTDRYEASLLQSNKDPNRYVISPWLENPDGGLMVLVDPKTKQVTVPLQYTGVNAPDLGPVLAIDVATFTGGQIPSNSHFDGKAFYLDLGYVLEDGRYFCFVTDLFQITEWAQSNAKRPAVKKSSMTFAPFFGPLYTKNF